MKRKIAEALESRRDQMISALWANSNYDDDKGTRQNAIREIEANFQQAIDSMTGRQSEQEEEIDENNPFFAPVKKAQAQLEEVMNPEGTVAQVVPDEYSRYIDQ